MKKSKKIAPIKKVAMKLLHHRLVHISTSLLMAEDTAIFLKDVELRKDPDPFCTLCQISSMNKKSRTNNTLNPRAPFK